MTVPEDATVTPTPPVHVSGVVFRYGSAQSEQSLYDTSPSRPKSTVTDGSATADPTVHGETPGGDSPSVSNSDDLADVLAADPRPGITNVSFTAQPGTITVLCGASGSGKSTALRLLNGLVPHFHEGDIAGTVTVCGVPVSTVSLATTGTVAATVFQNPRTQFFTASVTSELAFALENMGIDPQCIRRRIQVASLRCGIEELRGRRLVSLSGGQLQRVACTCAVVADVPILMLDEATSNLSPQAIEELSELLKQLKAEGTTIIAAEHRLYHLRELADEVLYLREGRILQRFSGAEFFSLDNATRKRLGLRCLFPPQMSIPVSEPSDPRAYGGDRSEHTDSVHDALGEVAEVAGAKDDDMAKATNAGDPSICTVAKRPSSTAIEEALELHNIRFSYGPKRILDIDHMVFPAGMVTGIIGANGVGKTTLARVICGLEKPARGGRILLQGKTLSAKARAAAGYIVMQDTGRQLFANTVQGEVTLGMNKYATMRRAGGRSTLTTKDATESADLAMDLLSQFGLAEYADRHPLSLSGGQKQRLVIATALAQNKKIHIFDEPTSGVDLSHLDAIAAKLRERAAEGSVVIVISHDAELINACCDRIIELRRPARGGS